MITPEVLLLGNGLNNASNGTKWSKLISDMSLRKDLPEKNIDLPYPLQIQLATSGKYMEILKTKTKDLVGIQPQNKLYKWLQQLMTMSFDDIMTTNYSYELERMLFPKETDTTRICTRIRNMMNKTTDHAESRYMLHTFNQVGEKRIWHIHGEARKPSSMIIGHYEYASLLSKLKMHSDRRRDAYQRIAKKPLKQISWVDQFILGNVYVLGFGFDPSEMDLWWLLNRKKNEKADHGSIYFYEPRKGTEFNAKIELLRAMDVEVRDLGMTLSTDNVKRDQQYEEFYSAAISDIKEVQKQTTKALTKFQL